MCTFARSRLVAIPFLALLAALVVPAFAAAAPETFHRFEAEATANFVATQDCGDGTTTQFRVTVIGGREEQTESGETTVDEFVTVLLRGFDCEGNFVSDRGSAPADFEFSRSLQTASVSGTVTTSGGRTVEVDMTWEGTGPIESTSNTTTFPGFAGHFQGMRRDALATGTVVVDGETLVDGTTTNAQIETLEDRNIRTSSGG